MTSLPEVLDVDAVISSTWPAETVRSVGGFSLREGGGGQRATATTLDSNFDIDALNRAEQAMAGRAEALFRVRPGQIELDAALDGKGYMTRDATVILAAPTEIVADRPLPKVSAFNIWPPLAIMEEIWTMSDVGPDRQAIMHRADVAKTGILGRTSGQAAGVGFVACDQKIAMIHAVAVLPDLRRQKAAENMMISAGKWAQDIGAVWMSTLCTCSNLTANKLYASMGFKPLGQYHYRYKTQ